MVFTTTFKLANPLRDKLVHVKDLISKKKSSNLVYDIEYAHPGCNGTYRGWNQASPWSTIRATHQTCALRGPDLCSLHQCQTNRVSNLPRSIYYGPRKRWFEGGVKEAIWEKVEASSLKKKWCLRFKLSHAWDELIRNTSRCLSCDAYCMTSHDSNELIKSDGFRRNVVTLTHKSWRIFSPF